MIKLYDSLSLGAFQKDFKVRKAPSQLGVGLGVGLGTRARASSPDDVHAGVASLDGVVSYGTRVLLHAQSLGSSQRAGVQTTPLQPAELLLVAGVVVDGELLHGNEAPVLGLQNTSTLTLTNTHNRASIVLHPSNHPSPL